MNEISNIPKTLQKTAVYISVPQNTGVYRVTLSRSSIILVEIVTLVFPGLIKIILIYAPGVGTLRSYTELKPSEINDGLY